MFVEVWIPIKWVHGRIITFSTSFRFMPPLLCLVGKYCIAKMEIPQIPSPPLAYFNCQTQLQLQPQLDWRLRWPYSWLLQPPNQPDSLYQTRFQINYEKKLIMNHQKRGEPNWTLTCAWHNFSHSLFLSLLSIMNNSTAALHIPHKPFPHLEQMSRSCFFMIPLFT